jgi:hypothetical protein
VRELERAAGDLGAVGAMMHTEVSRRNVADEEYWPIYAMAQRLNLPIAYHAHGSGSGDTYRWRNFLGVHTWSHLPEQLITAASVAYGGVLERFPDLRVAFLEAGVGWVPFWLEHLDEEWEKRKFDAPLLTDRPSAYLTNGRCWYSCDHLRLRLSALGRRLAALGRHAAGARRSVGHAETQDPGRQRAALLRHGGASGRAVARTHARAILGEWCSGAVTRVAAG